MYTPIIAPGDLATHLQPEIINEIVRNNNATIVSAIDAAIQEAKMYLSKYDSVKLFGTTDLDGVSATFSDTALTNMIKVMAIWHLILLAQPNVQYDLYKDRYEETIATLKNISIGKLNPGWPYLDTTGETAPQGRQVKVYATKRRNTSY